MYSINTETGLLEDVEINDQEDISEMSTKTSRPSSSNSNYTTPRHEPKRKKKNIQSEDILIKAATDTLNKLASSISPELNKDKIFTNENLDSEKNSNNKTLANYMVSKLNQINNDEIRLETEQQIMTLLYDAIKRDRIGKNNIS